MDSALCSPFDQMVVELRGIVDSLELLKATVKDPYLVETAKKCERRFGGDLRTHRQFFLDRGSFPTEDQMHSISDQLEKIHHDLGDWIAKTRNLKVEDLGDDRSLLTYFELTGAARKFDILQHHLQQAEVCLEAFDSISSI